VCGLVAFVVAANIVNRFGHGTAIWLALATGAAAWTPSDRCRELIALFRRALVRAGVSEKEFGIDYGTSKGQLADAFACAEQFSFSRAANTSDDVWLEFARELLEQSNRFVVMEKGPLADLVLANRDLIAALDDKRPTEFNRSQWAEAERRIA
jgi:hypothetical protein